MKFKNESDVAFSIQENDGQFFTDLIKPNETASLTIIEPGQYKYFAKPWMTGTITVVEQ